MGKGCKPICKSCPHCDMQIAVACKICPGCKKVLINSTKRPNAPVEKPAPPPPPPPPEPTPASRRTSRIKREKPKFYDASQFETKKVVKRKKPDAEVVLRGKQIVTQQPALNKKKIKKKVKVVAVVKDEGPDEEEPPPVNVTAEKSKQLSIVLNELNLKLFSTSWTAV